MSYYTTPFPTKFPAIIPRHWYPPAASLRGFGQDPQQPVDVSNWWTQAQQYAQQYMPGGVPDPNAPVPPAPAPAPAPTPSTDPNAPQATIVSDSASSTLLMTGAIALVAVIGGVFLYKETR